MHSWRKVKKESIQAMGLTKITSVEVFNDSFFTSCRTIKFMQDISIGLRKHVIQSGNTYVTMRTPLLFNQAKITCAGVAPSLVPIVLRTGSTGPPGFLVSGLSTRVVISRN